MKKTICHLTSVHQIYDVRIFVKECVSLAKRGFSVSLIGFANESGNEIKDGVNVIKLVDANDNRVTRIYTRIKAIYKKALEVDADIYHIHDPELLLIANKLKKKGKKVIFDSHEDVPQQILTKKWVPGLFRKRLANVYASYERSVLRKLDGVIGVTPTITARLKTINGNTIQVTNYPIVSSLSGVDKRWGKSICFAGGVVNQWCHENIIKALDNFEDVKYYLVGNTNAGYLDRISKLKSWVKAEYLGKIPFSDVPQFIANSSAGMALNQYNLNVGNRTGSLGNTKLFEYMQVGIPVICTDFVLWKEIIDKYDCGICVNPNDPTEIAQAIRFVMENPAVAKQMGENGRKAIEEEFNWAIQEEILVQLYNKL